MRGAGFLARDAERPLIKEERAGMTNGARPPRVLSRGERVKIWRAEDRASSFASLRMTDV
jgi:hypothetical protein